MYFPCPDSARPKFSAGSSARQDPAVEKAAEARDGKKVVVLFPAPPAGPDHPPDGGGTCCAALASPATMAVLRGPDGQPSLYVIPAAGARAYRLSTAGCTCHRAA